MMFRAALPAIAFAQQQNIHDVATGTAIREN
jgi:hypothetical protein